MCVCVFACVLNCSKVNHNQVSNIPKNITCSRMATKGSFKLKFQVYFNASDVYFNGKLKGVKGFFNDDFYNCFSVV